MGRRPGRVQPGRRGARRRRGGRGCWRRACPCRCRRGPSRQRGTRGCQPGPRRNRGLPRRRGLLRGVGAVRRHRVVAVGVAGPAVAQHGSGGDAGEPVILVRWHAGRGKVEDVTDLRDNPHIAAWHFHTRFTAFRDYVLKPKFNITDSWDRYEWQARGSPHSHGLYWANGAPIPDMDSEVWSAPGTGLGGVKGLGRASTRKDRSGARRLPKATCAIAWPPECWTLTPSWRKVHPHCRRSRARRRGQGAEKAMSPGRWWCLVVRGRGGLRVFSCRPLAGGPPSSSPSRRRSCPGGPCRLPCSAYTTGLSLPVPGPDLAPE